MRLTKAENDPQERKSTTIRFDQELKEKLDNHLAILKLVGIDISLSDFVQTLTSDYLVSFHEEVCEAGSDVLAGRGDAKVIPIRARMVG